MNLTYKTTGLLTVQLNDRDDQGVEGATGTLNLESAEGDALLTEAPFQEVGNGEYNVEIPADLNVSPRETLKAKVLFQKSGRQAYAEYGLTVQVDED